MSSWLVIQEEMSANCFIPNPGCVTRKVTSQHFHSFDDRRWFGKFFEPMCLQREYQYDSEMPTNNLYLFRNKDILAMLVL